MKTSKVKYTDKQLGALKLCCDQNQIYYNITKKNFIVRLTDEDNMTKAPVWFQHWADTEFKPLKKDVASLKEKVDLIMQCPTIKKELENIDNKND